MNWEKTTKEKFDQIMGKVPVFMRPIAEKKVSQKAISLAQAAGHEEVIEKDMVDAFFAETPFGFHGPLKCDMEEFGIDYTKYGHSK